MDQASQSSDALWREAQVLDLTGLKCPLPSLLTAKALRSAAPGALVAVTVTDAMAPLDLRHLCQRDGHEMVEERGVDAAQNATGARRLLIRRGPRS